MHASALTHLQNPRLNKGTAFTAEERERLGLHGLLPPKVSTMSEQVEIMMENLRKKPDDIDRYRYLASLSSRNERLHYRVLIDHIEELMPVVYTPTVGLACQQFAYLFRESNGFYLSIEQRGRVRETLANWVTEDVRLIVVTDGERILGLGDLGVSGMGIPIGKLALYCACAGIDPAHCLPITLDVGTNNSEFQQDPRYLGRREDRVREEAYDDFIEEFIGAVQERFPKALLQFEDFATPNAVALLERYRDRLLCFNDDIQGTAAVSLAGLVAATRLTGTKLSEMRFLFVGAGSAATGIASLLALAMEREGLSAGEARSRCVLCDSKGVITRSRESLTPHSAPFAADLEPMSYVEAIDATKPHAIIGATGRSGMFTAEVISKMANWQDHPIIFALSNPTSRAECTAEEAYRHSEGRAIFASGSPFAPVEINGEMKIPGQGNNAYVFPGLGLGVLAAEARRITDAMLITAAQALAETVSEERLAQGSLYPPLHDIRKVSQQIAIAVARTASEEGLTETVIDDAFAERVSAGMYDPRY